MALLQPRLNLKVSQRQVLTPGLMQMVSVLALNKLELKEMIDAEMVENPVLEEIDESVPMLDEVAGREGMLERSAEEAAAPPKDVFSEIDFGSYFQDYLDPGFRTQPEFDDSEKPSFENFLSQPTTLSDHLAWQLGALSLEENLHNAAEFVIGNLDEDGYLGATDEELATAFNQFVIAPAKQNGHKPEVAAGETASNPDLTPSLLVDPEQSEPVPETFVPEELLLMRRAIDLVQHLDPIGVGARDLRECLLLQIVAQQQEFGHLYTKLDTGATDDPEENPHGSFRVEAEAKVEERRRAMEVAALIVDHHLQLLQKRDVKDLAHVTQVSVEEAHAGVEFIRTLDPRPGRLYNREQTRLIEPDVVFVKRAGSGSESAAYAPPQSPSVESAPRAAHPSANPRDNSPARSRRTQSPQAPPATGPVSPESHRLSRACCADKRLPRQKAEAVRCHSLDVR